MRVCACACVRPSAHVCVCGRACVRPGMRCICACARTRVHVHVCLRVFACVGVLEEQSAAFYAEAGHPVASRRSLALALAADSTTGPGEDLSTAGSSTDTAQEAMRRCLSQQLADFANVLNSRITDKEWETGITSARIVVDVLGKHSCANPATVLQHAYGWHRHA